MIRNIYILLLLSLSFGTVTDIDGNVYETVQIGDQLWMAENLQVTHYNDGSEIPNPSDDNWQSNQGQYGVYDNEHFNADIYGNLYNFPVIEDERGVCPDGFHVPSDDEFKELEMFLGMSEEDANDTGYRGADEGSKLAGRSDLWNDGVLENNPEFGTSGFNALPAGRRSYIDGTYQRIGNYAYFWSSSENNPHAYYRLLYYYNSHVARNSLNKKYGFSIRCLGD